MKKTIPSNVISQIKFNNTTFDNEDIIIESPPISTCEKVKEFRGNLIANVSHDLRTPLQSIIGYSETILLNQKDNSDSNKEQEDYLKIILANANKLSSMIEQFFEYSKLEISEVLPEKKSFSPERIVQELDQNYKLISFNKKIDFSIHSEENLPHIYGDYLMVYRVFQNLIDNALKFTSEGGKIKIQLIKKSKDKLQVQISDTGKGIPYSELDSIFNKFKTSKKVASGIEQNDGLGLGLAIVKKILSLHNAEIFVNSELGVGTTFTFLLPFEAVLK